MAGSHLGLAKIYLEQGRFGPALVAIDESLRLGSDPQSAHYLRGRILAKLGRREEAQKEMSDTARMGSATSPNPEPNAFDEDHIRNPELAQPPQ
jgi:Flp pilus assembly protein TadD